MSAWTLGRAVVETWKLLSDRADPMTGATAVEFAIFYTGFERYTQPVTDRETPLQGAGAPGLCSTTARS